VCRSVRSGTRSGDTAIMGNMDPAYLLAPRDVMFRAATDVLKQAVGRPGHIFNLGHGIMPEADPAQVRALIDHVHEASARLAEGR
jgi:uroporphyrinogen decarboxylase